MGESEFNFDNELETLLRDEAQRQQSQERKKLPYYTESVDPERNKLVKDFYDHYVSLSPLETFDDFLMASNPRNTTADGDDFYSDNDFDEYEDSIAPRLNELFNKSVQDCELMASGEMYVEGEGVLLFVPDRDDDADSEVLEDGSYLIGDISQYAALPSISYEDFLRMQQGEGSLWANRIDGPVESPSPWILMDNVVRYDATGVQQMTYEQVMLPLEYPSLHFKKVIRQEESTEAAPNIEEVYAPLATNFTGDGMLNVYSDIENNLNYNNFEPGEFGKEYEYSRQDLGVYMGMVDTERYIQLSVSEAIVVGGIIPGFDSQVAQYVEPTIIRHNDTWRVVHAFMVQTEDGDFNVAHALPEHIIAIEYRSE